MESKWDKRFMDMALMVGSWSKDPSTQVGAVIVDSDRRILAVGYNGFPAKFKDLPERILDRDTKLKLTVHAEQNAIDNAARNGVSIKGATIYVSKHPCFPCFLRMASTGIAKIVYKVDSVFEERWKDPSLKSYANEAGIQMVGMYDAE